jgi:hypothetical protein
MAQTRGPVTIQRRGDSIIIANDYLERALTVEDGCLRTSSFTNKLSHRTYSLSGGEFQLELIDDDVSGINPEKKLTTRDFSVVDQAIDEEPAGGRKVTFHLDPRQKDLANLVLTVSYELRPDEYYTRQWMEMKSEVKSTDEIHFLHYLAVFKDKWDSASTFDLGGLGQPLFGEDVFMGLEYPSGVNDANGNEVSLGSYVGLNIPKEGFVSAPSLIGVTLPGRVHETFMAYISRIRIVPARPYIEYNNFYDVYHRGMNTQNTLERVAELEAHLLKPYSLHLGTFTLDDGWDDPGNLWAIDEKRFPNGFQDVTTALHNIHSNLGLWLSPMGGYGPDEGEIYGDRRNRVAAGKRIGLEVASNRFFCMSGEEYNRYLRRAIVDLITKYGVNYWKFDGIRLACNETNHGHAVGIYSREAVIRNVIALAHAIRAANPHTVIDFSTLPLLSPWWLLYGDLVDYGGADFSHIQAIPSPTPRQSAISYRDAIAYQDIKVGRAQFPMSSLSSTGIIKNLHLLGGQEESLDDWRDEVVNYASSGVMLMDLMLSPTGQTHELLTSEEWEALGRALQYYVRNGHPLLDNSTWVLGDPARGEAYGFLHYSAEKTIILLRNPSVRPARVSLQLSQENGFEPTQVTFWAHVVYPFRESLSGVFTYGSALEVTLDGYEQRVFELTPVRGDVARIEGIRFSQIPSGDGNISYTVYAAKDSEATVHLSNTSLYLQAEVDGRKAQLRTTAEKDQGQTVLQFGRAGEGESHASCQSSPIRTDGKHGSGQLLDIALSCVIPSDFQPSEMSVLLESTEKMEDIEGDVVLDGKAVPIVVAPRGGTDGTPLLEKSKQWWYWSATTLTPGRHAVEFKLRFPSGLPSSVQVSGWLRGRRLLAARRLRLVLQRGRQVHPLEEDLLPSASQVERKTYPLFEERIH